MKKLFLHGPYSPKHSENLMSSEGSLDKARAMFLRKRFNNLDFLLKQRYGWMNDYLCPNSKIVEIGAGAGFSALYLDQDVILTDAIKSSWVSKKIDATQMDLASNSVDVIIASHNIHHFYSPFLFFEECQRVLKSHGLLLIQEINTSLLMRGLLRIMRHEGWSYDKDVFKKSEIVNDAEDPWSANCAVPELLFSKPEKFAETFTQLKIERNELCEGFIFPLSGGVTAKTGIPEIPTWFLNAVHFCDDILIKLLPNIFALGRRVVLRKI